LRKALDEGRPVFVDGTAAWCATCQVNEWNVLGKKDVLAAMERRGVVLLRADFTRPSPVVEAWLISVARAGLPAYALYVPGRAPYLFPELLLQAPFLEQLNRLLPSQG
jgi:thiol:disulfide interchange protein DsbD